MKTLPWQVKPPLCETCPTPDIGPVDIQADKIIFSVKGIDALLEKLGNSYERVSHRTRSVAHGKSDNTLSQ